MIRQYGVNTKRMLWLISLTAMTSTTLEVTSYLHRISIQRAILTLHTKENCAMALARLSVARSLIFGLAMAERQIIKIAVVLIARLGILIITRYWMN